MSVTDDHYVTVTEAAERLRVAPSTIRRWIREGDLSAYRVGKRRLALRREDLVSMIVPAQMNVERPRHDVIYDDVADIPRMTPERIQQGLDALDRGKNINKASLAQRGGEPIASSVAIIREMREERLRQLG